MLAEVTTDRGKSAVPVPWAIDQDVGTPPNARHDALDRPPFPRFAQALLGWHPKRALMADHCLRGRTLEEGRMPNVLVWDLETVPI